MTSRWTDSAVFVWLASQSGCVCVYVCVRLKYSSFLLVCLGVRIHVSLSSGGPLQEKAMYTHKLA